MNDHGKLIQSAAKLTRHGFEVEVARSKLRRLVNKGIPYDSAQMLHALLCFRELDAEWKELEQRHLVLREKIVSKEATTSERDRNLSQTR
jgi:hypothetical protein